MQTEHLTPARRWLILVAVGLFTFMSTLDSSIVNIALPTISKELGIQMNQATWTVSIYLIAVSAMLIFFGRLGDLIGKIRVFRVGTLIFTIGSLLCGLNFGLEFLLFARFVQALGASMTMSNSFGITTSCFPPKTRARAMSMIGIFVALGSVTGPGLGGLLLQVSHWSSIFWVNVPIGIFAMILGEKLFPKEPKQPLDRKQLDWWGTILFFFSIGSLFLGIEIGQNQGFNQPITVVSVILAVILFVLFILCEMKTKTPMIQLKMFKNSLFSVSLISAMLIFVTNFFASILMPFYLQDLLKYSPGNAGILMMVFPLVMMVVSPIGGYLGDHFDKEKIAVAGIFLVAIAQLGYTYFAADTSWWFIVIFTVFNAAGASLFQSPNNALVMESVEKDYLGVAGSINALARNLGMITGISIATTTLFSTMSKNIGYRVTTYVEGRDDIFLNGMHVAFYVSFGISVVTLIIVVGRMLKKSK
ncbi:drug resistance transporter, EmrB/QacA subfamily [Pilibacter termitis]|uniref:Drug resistance transporter, EmrB/QacA subfamily n=1 Tax=Pilibacter termitis TaxID=263852 RepID=A0A1T4LWU2_9ENTE|nr:MFS transporter [Pilibacter termitis]SJZ59111.1 drug resistance transporter, EmrB/QacA subfamily [Pilibacter termitis]